MIKKKLLRQLFLYICGQIQGVIAGPAISYAKGTI